MAEWWKHYKFKDEPYLSTEPLVLKEDMELFIGRENEIKKLSAWLQGRAKKAILVTGAPGSGKSSFVSRLLVENPGYVRVNLSQSNSIFDADVDIADEFIRVVETFNISLAEKYRKRLIAVVTETTGRQLQAGVAPMGIRGSATSVFQRAYAPVRSIEISSVIRDSANAIVDSGNRIALFIDETDFFDDAHSEDIVKLVQRLKEKLPSSSILIVANRDLDDRFSMDFHNPQTLVRSTFKNVFELDEPFSPDSTNLESLIESRLQRGKPTKMYTFPFTERSSRAIVSLSGGNFKTLLMYLEYVMIEGAQRKLKLPLEEKFVRNEICSSFDDACIHSDNEKNVLCHLAKSPSHLSDPDFSKLLPRSTLHELLRDLERRALVRRNTRRLGVKQIYSVTEKAIYIMKKT